MCVLPLRMFECLEQVLYEVAGVLEPNGQPQEVGRGRAVGSLDGLAVLDEALRPAEGGRAAEQLHTQYHLQDVGCYYYH